MKPQKFPSFFTTPRYSLYKLLGTVLVGTCLGLAIGEGIKLLFCIRSPDGALDTLPGYRNFLLLYQVAFSSSTFIGAPLFYFVCIEKQNINQLFQWKKKYLHAILLTIALVFVWMQVNTVCIQWNKLIKLPAWLAPFELWTKQQEAAIQNLIAFLTTFKTPLDFVEALLIMALLPAIGEELLFRGILQNILYPITQQRYMAIWISALVFSAIHCQFYSFLPRFTLGLLFGYLYQWTQDLIFPMIAHFFNNAFTLLLLWVSQKGYLAQGIEDTPLPVPVLCLFAILGLLVGFYFREYSKPST